MAGGAQPGTHVASKRSADEDEPSAARALAKEALCLMEDSYSKMTPAERRRAHAAHKKILGEVRTSSSRKSRRTSR